MGLGDNYHNSKKIDLHQAIYVYIYVQSSGDVIFGISSRYFGQRIFTRIIISIRTWLADYGRKEGTEKERKIEKGYPKTSTAK